MNAISDVKVTGFTIRSLSVLAYANGFTLWLYKSAKDRLDTVAGANYFAHASDMVTAGDMIMVAAPDGGRILVVTMTGLDAVITGALS